MFSRAASEGAGDDNGLATTTTTGLFEDTGAEAGAMQDALKYGASPAGMLTAPRTIRHCPLTNATEVHRVLQSFA